MISGEVNAYREAIIPLRLRGPNGREVVLDGIIDTGFSEFLTLSPSTITDLELPYQDTSRVIPGDGRVQALHVYEATLVWGDQERVVLVHATDGGCLIGMALLYGHDLRIQVVDGGKVAIEALA
jgi:predicted aspartyl protease